MENILKFYKSQLETCKNKKELKKVFFEGCKKLHPDVNNIPDNFIKDFNNYYQELAIKLSSLKIKDDIEINTDIDISVFDELFKYQSQYKIDIELVGSWIWLELAYPNKKKQPEEYQAFTLFKDQILKTKFGFVWSKQNKRWYLSGSTKKGYSSKCLSMEDKYTKYGRVTIKPTTRKRIV